MAGWSQRVDTASATVRLRVVAIPRLGIWPSTNGHHGQFRRQSRWQRHLIPSPSKCRLAPLECSRHSACNTTARAETEHSG